MSLTPADGRSPSPGADVAKGKDRDLSHGTHRPLSPRRGKVKLALGTGEGVDFDGLQPVSLSLDGDVGREGPSPTTPNADASSGRESGSTTENGARRREKRRSAVERVSTSQKSGSGQASPGAPSSDGELRVREGHSMGGRGVPPLTPGKSKTKLGIVEGSFDMSADAGPFPQTGATKTWLTASVDSPHGLGRGSRTLDDQLNYDAASLHDERAAGQKPTEALGTRAKSKTRLVVSVGDETGFGHSLPDMLGNVRGARLAAPKSASDVGTLALQSLPSILSTSEMKAYISYDKEALGDMRLPELRTLLTSLEERMADMNLYLVKVIDARNLSQAEFDKSEARLADYLMTLNDSNEKSAREHMEKMRKAEDKKARKLKQSASFSFWKPSPPAGE